MNMMLEGLFYATAPRRVRVSSGRTLMFFDLYALFLIVSQTWKWGQRKKGEEKGERKERDERAKCFLVTQWQPWPKIVLRSQWGWCGGVKKLFKWINSPSLLFPAASLACVWLSLSKAHIAGVYLSLYCLRRNMGRFKRSDGWPCCIWRCRPVERKGRRAGLRPGSGVFPCQGFHPHPLLPPHAVSPDDCVVYRFSQPRH